MTTPSDLAFVDTNVLVYAADSSAVFHEASKNLIERAADGRLELAVSPSDSGRVHRRRDESQRPLGHVLIDHHERQATVTLQ